VAKNKEFHNPARTPPPLERAHTYDMLPPAGRRTCILIGRRCAQQPQC